MNSKMFFYEFGKLIYRVDGFYAEYAKEARVKENLLWILYALNDGGEHSQKEICDSSKKKVYNEIIKLKDVKSFNEYEHGDLSTIEETRQILDSIETEISLTIGGYAKQNNIEVVLNMASNSKNSEYDELWDKTEKFGNLLAGNNLYFILSKKNISMPLELNTIDTPQLIYWLEIMKNPMVSDVYLTDDYPVIIYGGERIDDKIIEQIYHKYSVDSNVKEIVKLVLSKYFINWE